jgi:hypothetical protein
MSRKKANSALPSELNENWGSNYMMDGFWHDMEYGKGNRDSIDSDPVPQPPGSGFSHLPDGVIMGGEDCAQFHDLPDNVEQEQEGAMDLEGLGIVASFDPTSDIANNGVTDRSWLADAFQDPDRLPGSPHDDMIPELQDAWGARTDGLHRVEMYDREDVQPNLGDRPSDDDTLNLDKLAHLVRHAMRRSAAGHPVARTCAHIEQLLGASSKRIAAPLRAIEAEHGLAGNVYLRASAYPGLHRGKWSTELRRSAKHAKYLIASANEDCSGCAAAMGLKVVAHPNEIDWDAMYAYYAPGLQASGRLGRSASVKNKREALRKAFQREGSSPRLDVETFKVKHTMPMDSVTAEEARAQIASAVPTREMVVNEDVSAVAVARLNKRLGSLVRARLLSADEATRLMQSKAPVTARLKMAELLAVRAQTGTYSGTTRDHRVQISREDYEKAIPRTTEHHLRSASTAEQNARGQMLHRFEQLEVARQGALGKTTKLAGMVARGLRGKKLRALVAKSFTRTERGLVASTLDPILVKGGFFEKDIPQSREYDGAVIREAVAQKHEAAMDPREIRAVLRWAQQQMNEGFVGDDLDGLLTHRFSPPLLKAASVQLVQVRKQHEGVAGHLYVDASVYASAKGTKGCEEGALKHRTNGLKLLLAMDRCQNCVFKNAESVCQKYNKPLVHEVPSEVATKFRREVLAAARKSDAEATGAMFSVPDVLSSVDPVSEYGLHNGALDDVESSEVRHEMIDGIFFGGFEV